MHTGAACKVHDENVDDVDNKNVEWPEKTACVVWNRPCIVKIHNEVLSEDRGRSRSKLGGDDEPSDWLTVYFSIFARYFAIAMALSRK